MFWCSKEPSRGDGSFEYPQHMFCLRNTKKIFSIIYFYLGAKILNKTSMRIMNKGLRNSVYYIPCYGIVNCIIA